MTGGSIIRGVALNASKRPKERRGQRPLHLHYDGTGLGALPFSLDGRVTMNDGTLPRRRTYRAGPFSFTFYSSRGPPHPEPHTQTPHGGDPANHRGGWLGWCGGGWWYHYGTKPTNQGGGWYHLDATCGGVPRGV